MVASLKGYRWLTCSSLKFEESEANNGGESPIDLANGKSAYLIAWSQVKEGLVNFGCLYEPSQF